jgi:hypothetical protein
MFLYEISDKKDIFATDFYILSKKGATIFFLQ